MLQPYAESDDAPPELAMKQSARCSQCHADDPFFLVTCSGCGKDFCIAPMRPDLGHAVSHAERCPRKRAEGGAVHFTQVLHPDFYFDPQMLAQLTFTMQAPGSLSHWHMFFCLFTKTGGLPQTTLQRRKYAQHLQDILPKVLGSTFDTLARLPHAERPAATRAAVAEILKREARSRSSRLSISDGSSSGSPVGGALSGLIADLQEDASKAEKEKKQKEGHGGCKPAPAMMWAACGIGVAWATLAAFAMCQIISDRDGTDGGEEQLLLAGSLLHAVQTILGSGLTLAVVSAIAGAATAANKGRIFKCWTGVFVGLFVVVALEALLLALTGLGLGGSWINGEPHVGGWFNESARHMLDVCCNTNSTINIDTTISVTFLSDGSGSNTHFPMACSGYLGLVSKDDCASFDTFYVVLLRATTTALPALAAGASVTVVCLLAALGAVVQRACA